MAGQSGCKDCKDLWPTGYNYMMTTFYSSSCEMQTYPDDQDCNVDTSDWGVICFTSTASCNIGTTSMKLWYNRTCSQGPPQVLSSSCDNNWFGYTAGSWQDVGDIPPCP